MPEGNVFYRRQHLYDVTGKMPNLGDYILAGCRYGGPFAIMRDPSKVIVMGREATPWLGKSQIWVKLSRRRKIAIT